MTRTLKQHLDPKVGPKRILSLDGGGIRGALTVGYLQKIEDILREKSGNPDLLLCDYFDLIGGTSTGSIIAAGLAIGKSVKEIKDLYMDLGGKIFGDKKNWWNPFETMSYLRANYDHKALEDSLKNVFGTTTLGGDEIRTGLCIVAKRADTNSTWPLINHPDAKYYPKNKNIPLWQAVRASSAAPTYFVPQMIDVGDGEIAAFVDGGVSTANNPSLTLLMIATLKGYKFNWEMGEDNLEVTSIGTGYGIFKKQIGEIKDAWLATWAQNVPNMLMQDSSWQNQTVLQWMSKSPTALSIDGEMGDLTDDYVGGKPLIKYLRYNFPITEDDLKSLNDPKLGQEFTEKDVKSLLEMSDAKNRYKLYDIGAASAEQIVKAEHFMI